jgi:hypothetical protein
LIYKGDIWHYSGLFFVASIFLLLAALVLSACNTGNTTNPPIASDPTVVEWETAVEWIMQGNAKQVSQTHSLDVYLDMKSGEQYKTTEPAIDDVFKVIEACGDPCKDMILATE